MQWCHLRENRVQRNSREESPTGLKPRPACEGAAQPAVRVIKKKGGYGVCQTPAGPEARAGLDRGTEAPGL